MEFLSKEELSELTIKEIKAYADKREIEYSKTRKDDLIDEVYDNQNKPTEKPSEHIEEPVKKAPSESPINMKEAAERKPEPIPTMDKVRMAFASLQEDYRLIELRRDKAAQVRLNKTADHLKELLEDLKK